MRGNIINRVYHKYEKESSKLRIVKGGGWTINLNEVDLTEFDAIVYETNKNIYKISKRKAQRVGIPQFLGGEDKLIIALVYWEITRKENLKKKESKNVRRI